MSNFIKAGIYFGCSIAWLCMAPAWAEMGSPSMAVVCFAAGAVFFGVAVKNAFFPE